MAKKEIPFWRRRIEYALFRFFYDLFRRLPLRAAFRIAHAVFLIFYWLDARHRSRTISHLLHAGVAHSRKEAAGYSRKVLREYSRLFVEIVTQDQHYDPRKIRISGPERSVERLFSKGAEHGNVILVSAHYGNWEINGTAIPELSGLPMCSVVRSFDNPEIGELINANRRCPLHTIVEKRGSLRPLLRTLKKGGIAHLLIDQHASREEGIGTVFFGHPCRTHISPALLHLKTGIPILPEITRRVSENFEFEILLGDLIEYRPTGDRNADVQAISQLCTTALEKLIARDPVQWMWAARRWLDINRPEETDYAVPTPGGVSNPAPGRQESPSGKDDGSH